MKIERIPGTNILDIKVTEQEVAEVCSKPKPLQYLIGITPEDIVSITDISTAEKLCLAISKLRTLDDYSLMALLSNSRILHLKAALKDMPEEKRAVDFINEELEKLSDKLKKEELLEDHVRTCFEKIKEALKEDL